MNVELLNAEQEIENRSFTNLHHTRSDLRFMRIMAHQLVDVYDDPDSCDFTGGNNIVQSDPGCRYFRIHYIQPGNLFNLTDLTVVGFFGQKRPGADIRPLIQADKRFEGEFDKHSGLLSLSTIRFTNGDFGNLVLFTDEIAKQEWGHSDVHRELVAEISPSYYKSVRLNNGILPDGLDAPDGLEITVVKYLDYRTNPPWRGIRKISADLLTALHEF
jgi:hypothetical protein